MEFVCPVPTYHCVPRPQEWLFLLAQLDRRWGMEGRRLRGDIRTNASEVKLIPAKRKTGQTKDRPVQAK